MKTMFVVALALFAIAASIGNVSAFPLGGNATGGVDYYSMDYPERTTSQRVNDYNPPDHYNRSCGLAGRAAEGISYEEFCRTEREKFEALLGYDRAHTRM